MYILSASKWTTERIGPSTLTPHEKERNKKPKTYAEPNRAHKLEFGVFRSLGSKKKEPYTHTQRNHIPPNMHSQPI